MEQRRLWLCLLLCWIGCMLFGGVNGLSESIFEKADEIKYNVLLDELMPEELHDAEQKLKKGLYVEMTSPTTKRKYKCLIPEEEKEDQENKGNSQNTLSSAADLLSSLKGTCLIRRVGWWNYEICFGKKIRQFHQEKDKPIRPQDEFILGKYVGREGIETSDHFSEIYENGDVCDLTGKFRSTEIRFSCGSSTTTFIDIQEPSSCSYIAYISTPLLCQHPKYIPKKQKEETILCFPSDIPHAEKDPELEEDKEEDLTPDGASFTTPLPASSASASPPPPSSSQRIFGSNQIKDQNVHLKNSNNQNAKDLGLDFIKQQFLKNPNQMKVPTPNNKGETPNNNGGTPNNNGKIPNNGETFNVGKTPTNNGKIQQRKIQQEDDEEDEEDILNDDSSEPVVVVKFDGLLENVINGQLTDQDIEALKGLLQQSGIQVDDIHQIQILNSDDVYTTQEDEEDEEENNKK